MTCHFKNLDGLVWHSVFQITTGRKRRSVNQEEKAEHVDDHTADLVVGSYCCSEPFSNWNKTPVIGKIAAIHQTFTIHYCEGGYNSELQPTLIQSQRKSARAMAAGMAQIRPLFCPTCWAFTEQCWLVGLRWDMPRCFPFMPPNLLCSIRRQGWKSGGLATGCPCRTRVATGPANWVQQSWRTRLKWWSRGSRPRIVKKQGSCTTARSKKIPLIMICHFVLCVSENRDGLELPDFWFLVVFSFLTCSVGWTFHYWWIHQFLSVLACKYYLDCIYMKSSFSFSAPIVSHLVICPHRNF